MKLDLFRLRIFKYIRILGEGRGKMASHLSPRQVLLSLREELCKKLGAPPEQVELSMGMTQSVFVPPGRLLPAAVSLGSPLPYLLLLELSVHG